MATPLDDVHGQLHVLAARAAGLAAQVRERSDEVRAHARTSWTGAAADAYARTAAAEVDRLDRCADRLEDLAAALRGHARGAEQRLEEVAELFAAARLALDASTGRLPRLGGGR